MMKIAILGSTGSIGTSTLDVVDRYRERYSVVALAAGKNFELLASQVRKFRPRLVCVAEASGVDALRAFLGPAADLEILHGSEGMQRAARCPEADMVVAAISGSAGLLPTLAAIEAGKTVALANKEALVMAGELMIDAARRHRARIVPVDSEHSAVFQLLHGRTISEVRNIILTASGGPFLQHTQRQLDQVTPAEALNHPRWKMGNKVTIDSASLMNKGLEVIEAHWLFGIPADRIRVLIHPQSIIHAMIELIDGTMVAQLSEPDMRGPIAYALSCPDRLERVVAPVDFAALGQLTFTAPDERRFPTIGLAYRALRAGGLMPTAMNAANEVAVQQFCKGSIRFPAIALMIEKVMDRFQNDRAVNLENILWADTWARQESLEILRHNII
jgi:1-deoxy-D-xylulose-5-phosphate reductoisomerase